MKLKYLLVVACLCQAAAAFAQDFQKEAARYRKEYLEGFLKDQHSPLKKEDLKNLHFYEADSNFRVQAKVTLLEDQKPFKMPTFDGTSKEFIRYATLSFTLAGESRQLTLYRNIALASNAEYKDYLFLPFTDQTNSTETYGGGRYIDVKTSDIKDGNITIDFNRAYNPYCAYSSGYRCPVPPEENDLSLAVKAGEKQYTGEKKQRDAR